MTLVPDRGVLGIGRHFTNEGSDPYDAVTWERRDSRLVDHRDGSVAFEQLDVEVPDGWSVNATNILAQKYFRGTPGTAGRESSLRQVADRVVDTIAGWGLSDGYFVDDAEAATFADELKHLIVTQRAAFNSPVWFNIGVAGVPQQASACFILSVDDQMSSILNWYVEEGTIFKGGSGAGINLSRIRSSRESLAGGGSASGPVSFMRGADASAGTIKSGGKTRRAAKMVILDAGHPDVEDFIWCKAREEKKIRVLEEAGFDVGFDGTDSHSIQYQNANNSVRVTDEFMEAVDADADWDLLAVTDGSVIETLRARDLFRQISQAAWECADPGVQFDTTINSWNTASNTGRIRASNPCAEFVHLDNSACNLASLNLLKFLDKGDSSSAVGGFDIEGFSHAVDVVFTAQEILVGNADYPTESIGENARAFRQLGTGYANLGAMLMALGMPYDSDDGRAVAAAVTSLMTGLAYRASARLADRMGPFAGYETNREPTLGVLDRHREAAELLDDATAPALVTAGRQAWFEACALAQRVGVRNSQATVLAPTGTIGLLMDCDTTGIEPDLGLVKTKRLAGGGTMSIVNRTVPRALERLGYSEDESASIVSYIDNNHSVIGCPDLKPEHAAVFATSMGDNPIHHLGHIRMMGAVQPFLSGAISKTCNMPEDVSVDDVEELFMESWKLGLKAVAIYRDNCKVGQPLSSGKGESKPATPVVEAVPPGEPVRRKMPRSRKSLTFDFRVADCKGFVTVGEYEDGRPGEIFVRVSKQGSTLAGIMDAFAISLSHGLQYGVPLRAFVEAYTGMRFEPAGMTDDPELRIATSLIDYLFRRLAVEYLTTEERAEMNILTSSERIQPTLPGVEESATETRQGGDIQPDPPSIPSAAQFAAHLTTSSSSSAPMCMQCGVAMQRAGSCYVCTDCGATSGCS
ncbi:MAG: vitamin B12-dependent ribonucleotide reductase [Acidimicrobiales bacterium]|jgi:ribonucleoside-diphosphate reductase alpha chain|nr:vitamin B12-dependent ribonucleotide reductase [Acidimicrobiales bacterium]|tara:strand:+ start:24896 stop:27658 length:2763 start_codon:yes stop_codon:yes gene_type:complete